MSRTPSAHWVSDTLCKRVPYPDPPFSDQYNPHEISLGNGHREISHLLEIIYDQQASRIDKTKALRLLNDVLPGREPEAIQLSAYDALRPLLLQPPNGLLLHSIVALNTLTKTILDAEHLKGDIARLVEIIDPQIETPLRIAAATLLRNIAELLGPIPELLAGEIPIKFVEAAASELSTTPLLYELYILLSRITNEQTIRVPLIESPKFLKKLVKSISVSELQDVAINLAENISMDSSHKGKLALLDTEILDDLGPLLKSKRVSVRMAVVSLISLLAVPKEGKEYLAMSQDIADSLKKISENDADLQCRRAAMKCRIIIAELPMAKVIIGAVVDPSIPEGDPTIVNNNESDAKPTKPKPATPTPVAHEEPVKAETQKEQPAASEEPEKTEAAPPEVANLEEPAEEEAPEVVTLEEPAEEEATPEAATLEEPAEEEALAAPEEPEKTEEETPAEPATLEEPVVEEAPPEAVTLEEPAEEIPETQAENNENVSAENIEPEAGAQEEAPAEAATLDEPAEEAPETQEEAPNEENTGESGGQTE